MKDEQTSRLSERAILIRLSTHDYTAKKQNKALSEELCRNKNADSDVAEVTINLVPKNRLKAVNNAIGRAYRRHKELTLPFMRGGLDILPSEQFFDYRKEMKKVIASITNEVQLLKDDWPNIISKNKSRFGDIPEAKLPTAADLDRLFGIEMDIMPVPEIGDFRVQAGDDEIAEIKAQVRETYNDGITNYTRELYDRLGELVAKVHETMSERDKGFRDTLITNLKDFCERLPKYNLGDNQELESVRQEIIEKLGHLDPEDLREIPNKRKAAAKDAEEVLAKIADYIR